jgi:3-hydroxyacyl-CoA dehydrogenase
MGAGIAAHLANIGFEVTLLDLTKESVQAAFERAKSMKPPHFYVPETASKIRLGSIEENLEWVSEADWVCEAIVEKLDLKRDLFSKIEPLLNETAMISTNTSGLQISLLSEGRSESFQRRFLGTHFFNPPRYLKLLELIPTDLTDSDAVTAFSSFLEDKCARRVVVAKDTPGFIANRFGMWAMFHAIHVAEKLGLSIEMVDAICGPFLGRPRSGAFRLNDIVGLDIMQDIAQNLQSRCPDDPFIDALNTPRSMATLMERGHIGAKSSAGYYRREGKELLVLDLGTLAYRQPYEISVPSLNEFAKKPLGERLRLTLESKDEAGEFLRNHLIPTLQYADYLKEEISHSVQDFDRVMKWGFAWEMGPFELIDAIGPNALGLLDQPFYRDSQQRGYNGEFIQIASEPQFSTISDFPIIETNGGFNVRDLGDGVKAIALTTKMGTITPEVVSGITAFLDKPGYDCIVLTSEAKNFSFGFDLTFFERSISESNWQAIDDALIALQNLTLRLGSIRSVAAVFGHCLGAGTELAIGCTKVCSHPESTIGLPEAKVGLIPGGAGTALLAQRSQSAGSKRIVDVCMAISAGFVSANAEHAKSVGILRETDVTSFHPDQLIQTAKSLALQAIPSDLPVWLQPLGPLTGMIDTAKEAVKVKEGLSSQDELIADKVKHVFTKPTSFDSALVEERIAFLTLCKSGLTMARIRHMLENGKPLRN